MEQLANAVYCVPMALKSLVGFLRSRPRIAVPHLLRDAGRFAEFKRHDVAAGLRKLIAEQYSLLTGDQQLALQALAVFNAPVAPVAAQSLFPGLDADAALETLAYQLFLAQHNRVTDEFDLHPSVREYAYEQIAPPFVVSLSNHAAVRPEPVLSEVEGMENCPSTGSGRTGGGSGRTGAGSGRTDGQPFEEKKKTFVARLHAKAADFYAQMKKPETEWKRLPDVQPHLDEIAQRIAAGEFDCAAEVLNEIDFDYLQKWGYSQIVMILREQLRGKLTDSNLIRVNDGYLGSAYYQTGRVRKAIPLYEHALEMARSDGNKQNEGVWLVNLGMAYRNLGETRQAINYYMQALAIHHDICDRRGEVADLGNLGNAYLDLGETPQAMEHYTQTLAIARKIGDRRGEEADLGGLGSVYCQLGEIRLAIDYYTQALAIAREIGERRGEGRQLGNLGEMYLELCFQEQTVKHQSIEYHQQALEIHRDIQDVKRIPEDQKRLGVAAFFDGKREEAVGYFQQCLTACDAALANAQLYEVLYYKAFTLLALQAVAPASAPPGAPLAAYQQALAACSAAGVVKGQIHELERWQQICARRGLAAPLAPDALALLREKIGD